MKKYSSQVEALLSVLSETPMSSLEIMEKLNLSHRPTFRKNYLNPAKELGLVKETEGKPNSPTKKYFIAKDENEYIKTTNDLIDFIYESPSAFNVVDNIKKELLSLGYEELSDSSRFVLKEDGKYFITRNLTSIIAFKMCELKDDYVFQIIASHTDSPSFKIKPNNVKVKDGYTNILCEPYGGVIAANWYDRPLSLAGGVSVRNGNKVTVMPLDIKRNLLSIPSLCIHFRRDDKDIKNNFEVDLQPTIALNDVEINLNEIIAKELKINSKDIIDYDLFLISKEKGYIWGVNEELFSSPRIDDLQCAYASLKAFENSDNNENVMVFCCFDNEEVGSSTRQGGDSTFLSDVLKRINNSMGKDEEEYIRAVTNSFLVSADNGHAIHPNHPEYSDSLNKPYLNKGLVIKRNASQRYTTNGISSSVFKMILEKENIPYQYFTNRSDVRGGSTLGNILTTQIPLVAIDVGLPQLAMHSINETAGVKDTLFAIKAFESFYRSKIKIVGNDFIIK